MKINVSTTIILFILLNIFINCNVALSTITNKKPSSPLNVELVAGFYEITVSWSEPLFIGSSKIKQYRITSEPPTQGCTTNQLVRSCVINNLNPEIRYSFVAVAINDSGEGTPSDRSSSIYPNSGDISYPTNLEARFIDINQAYISFNRPTYTNGLIIKEYIIESQPRGLQCRAVEPFLSCTVALSNSVDPTIPYTFIARAKTTTNILSPSSPPSNAIAIATKPLVAPKIINLYSKYREVIITWEPLANNGGSLAPITSYTAISLSTSETNQCTANTTLSSCTIRNLESNTTYKFQVYASNIFGDSPISTLSDGIIPKATKPEALLLPPATIIETNSTSITIEWNKLESQYNGGGILNNYIVESIPEHKVCTTPHNENNTKFRCTISDLRFDVLYTFTVRAQNSIGLGEPSPPSATTILRRWNFTLTSSMANNGFNVDSLMPTKFLNKVTNLCDGNNNFPSLSWSNAPSNTKSFVLIVENSSQWVNLNLYNISSRLNSITEKIGGSDNSYLVRFTEGTIGNNSRSQAQWSGPCPSVGETSYFFKLYALSVSSLPSAIHIITRANFESQYSNIIITSSEIRGLAKYVAPTPLPETLPVALEEGNSTFTLNSTIISNGFTPNAILPYRFNGNVPGKCNGHNDFPTLTWNNIPNLTESLVLIVEDTARNIHLNLYNIPKNITAIHNKYGSPTIPSTVSFTDIGASTGRNSWYNTPQSARVATVGWSGPCSDTATNIYFKLYALNIANLNTPLHQQTRANFETTYQANIIGSSELAVQSQANEAFMLTSNKNDSGFNRNEPLPNEFKASYLSQCNGSNHFPKLTWTNIPVSTESLALIVQEKGSNWVSLNLSNIYPIVNFIPHINSSGSTKDVLFSFPYGYTSPNSWNNRNDTEITASTTWMGPCPNGTTSIYSFKLYALDRNIRELNITTQQEFETGVYASNILASSDIEVEVNP